ncbi:MAG: hypothetical protein FWE28_09130 [Oscillospiraceae bacterium]|nr:hypothetical protein [Oscillospiraceae bacterium]
MVDGVLGGVSGVLMAAFPDYAVYGDERVRQGLATPSFFVGLGECTVAPLPMRLRQVRQVVEVVYFPERQGDYTELWAVGPKALECMEQIALSDGSMVRGMNRRCFIQDGVMHMQVAFTMRLRPVEQRALMGELTIRQ